MTAVDVGIVGRIVKKSQPTIIRGSDAFIVTQLQYRSRSCEPYQIENLTAASAVFLDNEGGIYAAIGVLESADLGTIRFDIPASGSARLNPGQPASFEQHFEDDNGFRIIPFMDAINIESSLF